MVELKEKLNDDHKNDVTREKENIIRAERACKFGGLRRYGTV